MSLLTESVPASYSGKEEESEHRKYDLIPHCQYNDGVACEAKNRVCKKCGWNPIVAEMRKQAIEMGDTHFLRFVDRGYESYEELLKAVHDNVAI